MSLRLATGVQVTLWQLSREKSLIAKRCEMKGSSGHTSKANFGSAFVSSNPPTPASQFTVLAEIAQLDPILVARDVPYVDRERFFNKPGQRAIAPEQAS